MNLSHLIPGLPLLAASAMVSICVQDAQAQQSGPPGRLKNAYEAINAGKWNVAYDEAQAAINAFDKRAGQLGYGDGKFAQFWYIRGLSEYYMGEYAKAIETLKQGMEKHPGKLNEWVGLSYQIMAESAIKLKDYEQALVHLKAFTNHRTRGANVSQFDKDIPLGLIYALIAQCNFLSEKPDFNEGIKNLKLIASARYTAREGKAGRGIPDNAIITAFLSMVETSIKHNRPDVPLDLFATNRSIIALEPWRLADYAKFLFLLANQAKDKAAELEGEKAILMRKLSLELFALVPDRVSVQQNIQGIKKKLGEFPRVDDLVSVDKKQLDAVLVRFDEGIKNNNFFYGPYVILFTASDYISSGSARPCKAAYVFLNANYPELPAERKEENLFHTISMYTVLGEINEAQQLTKEFNTKYPNSKHAENVDVMSLQTLYNERRFEDALKQAESVIASNPTVLQTKEMAMYVEGASLYSLGRYKQSVEKQQAFVKEFPNSPYTGQSMYNIGAAYYRMQDYDRAIHALDKFTKKFPNKDMTPYLPYALYDRARAGSNPDASVAQQEKAMLDYDRLISEFPELALYPSTLFYKGLLLMSMKNKDEAGKLFKESYEAASKAKDKDAFVMAESLYRLTEMAVNAKNYKEGADYYDKYWAEVSSDATTSYFTKLMEAVTGLHAFINTDRKEEGMKRLEETIVSVSRMPNIDFSQLEKAIATYTQEYMKDHAGTDEKKSVNLEEAKKFFYNFPGVKKDDLNLIAMLRIALVGIYEKELAKVDKTDNTTIASLNAQIQIIFQDIERSLNIKDMTPYALIKLGTFFGENTDSPEKAIPYFEELLKRPVKRDNAPENKFINDAQFGLAQALSRSKDKAQVERAVNMMHKVIGDEQAKPKPNGRIIERAEYELAKFSYNAGDYADAVKRAFDYTEKYKSGGIHRVEAMSLWAAASEKLGNKDQAIQGYLNVYDTATGRISVSAPAIKRAMELLYERNNPKPDVDRPSDKLVAYKTGELYLNMTRALSDKMTVQERSMWREVEQLVNTYAEDPEIMEEARLAKERADARTRK